MRRIVGWLFIMLLISSGISAQIITTDAQGLKRSSLLKIEKVKKLKKPGKLYDDQTFLVGGLSFHPSQTSLYAMLGTVKQWGYYGKLKTDFSAPKNVDLFIESEEYSSLFVEKVDNGRFSLTAGGLYRLDGRTSVYAGVGYGSRWLYWNSTSAERYQVYDRCYKGIEAELGVLHYFRKLYLQAGLQTLQFQYMELNVGVGLKI